MPVESLTVREDVPEPMGKKSLGLTAVVVPADELAVDESDVIVFGGIQSYPSDEIAFKNRCRWYALLTMINSPHHFPTTGRSPALPKAATQTSAVQPSIRPLPFLSKNHSPVLGRNTPILAFPAPSQSPATGRSPARPKLERHLSTLQPSITALPLKSNRHVDPSASKMPILSPPLPSQSPTTAKSPGWPNFETQ